MRQEKPLSFIPYPYRKPTQVDEERILRPAEEALSISPDALSRQRSNHYAFRAGRNLPDKEFRYLRTVIVTAAVYWGLNSKLRLR